MMYGVTQMDILREKIITLRESYENAQTKFQSLENGCQRTLC